jgi:ferredoxin-nitrite reductase
VISPNIPDSRLGTFLREPLLAVFSANPHPLARALVSCTGSQFCKFALIETKNRSVALMDELAQELVLSKPVRIHWTGCPNSCGQPQVADIGLMGTKARKEGKTVEAVDIYMGGTVGKEAQLGECVQKGVPCEDLKGVLRTLLVTHFGAQPLASPTTVGEERGLGRDRTQFLTSFNTNGKLNFTFITEPEPPAINGAGKATQPVPVVPAAPAVVYFAKAGQSVTGDASQTILELAEAAGIDIDNSCRSGTCGTCKHKLLSGDITYTTDPEGLGEDERESGLILTCIAHSVGRIEIDY